MKSSGFYYIDDGDTARCDDCGLEISEWTHEKKPFAIHAERSPNCPFVRSMLPDRKVFTPISNFSHENSDVGSPAKRMKVSTTEEIYPLNILNEVSTLKSVRQRTFSHWPLRLSPSSSQMIDAGFFNCNVGDRVICIYCNLICQNWKTDTDDPFETHKRFSPKCPFVRARINQQQTIALHIINGQQSPNVTSSFRCQEIVATNACHITYADIPHRHATFTTWPDENLPSVDDLVRAGFFYTGTKTIVTCFYCNGSLQNWGATDNPTVEHARWFPNCAYIQQLCGPEFYQRIQESKRVYQERTSSLSTNGDRLTRGQLHIVDESMLSRYVAARLDLNISQSLLNRNYKLSVIKRCYEDQLRIKRDDFVSDCDLFIAVIILDKQIEYINGNKDNIRIPSQAIIIKQEQEPLPKQIIKEISNPIEQSAVNNSTIDDHQNITSLSNPCALCFTDEKRLACLPCGHLSLCTSCANSTRSCPICRREITAFIRVYL